MINALLGRGPKKADGPYGADVLWMLDTPVDWGKFMPDLQHQRRSTNVEDMRNQPWDLPLYAYRYLGMESSPRDIVNSLIKGLQDPTAPPPRTPSWPPADPKLANSSMAADLGGFEKVFEPQQGGISGTFLRR